MAILVRGKTTCPICSKVIGEHEEAVLFPHFVLNEADQLYPLSDAACHATCVDSDPVGKLMLAEAAQSLANTGPGKRICDVCGKEIQQPDDYLLIGYLASPARDALSNFNYTHLHKSHIAQWTRAKEFLAAARNTLAQGQWQGPVLAEIVREIETDTLVEDDG